MKGFLLSLAGLIMLSGLMFGQTSLLPQDSLLLAGIANDTTQLRQVTRARHGELIAARAQNLLGRYFYAKHMSTDAEREYILTYQQYPGTREAAEAAGRLGPLSYWNDRWDKAIPFFKEYLKIHPTGKDAQWASYCLVRSMFYTNDSNFVDAARSYLVSSHDSLVSKDALIEYDIVRYLGNNNQYDLAIEEAKKLITQYPDCEYINFAEMRIARYYAANGKTDEAIVQCNALLSKYPANTNESASAQHLLASVSMQTGDFASARREFRKVAHDDPDRTEFVNAAEYGIALADLGEGIGRRDSMLIEKAFGELQTFVHNHPQDKNVPAASMDIAGLCMSRGRSADAAAAYSTIIGFNPALIDTSRYASHTDEMKAFRDLVTQAHMAKASLLHSQMHDPTNALAEYNAVLSLDPQMPDARLNKALCLVDLGRTDEAKAILRQMVSEQTKMSQVAARILSSL